jgi:hypothetical protein
LAGIPEEERENLIQNLDMSFMSIDTRRNIIPKTPGRIFGGTSFHIGIQTPARRSS